MSIHIFNKGFTIGSKGLVAARMLSIKAFQGVYTKPFIYANLSTYSRLSFKSPSKGLIRIYQGNHGIGIKNYSTSSSSAPPPPPPSPKKESKGLKIFHRISRLVTFSLSSVLVLAASGVALLVFYLIISELLFPSGDATTFNKAVKMIEQSEVAQKALMFQKGDRLKAYGIVPGDRWSRNRPAQSTRVIGKDGKERLLMRFQVETPSGATGKVTLEQIDTSFWNVEFAYIALDIPHQKRLYVKEPHFEAKNYVPKPGFTNLGNTGFLGLKWGPKKDD